MTDDDIITAIIQREGADYTDRPTDHGGPTRFGITLATLAAWRGHPCMPADVAALTEGEARAIYRAQYILRPGFDKIGDPVLRSLVVDWGVTSGPVPPTKALQRAVNVAPDGILGPATAAAVNAADPKALFLTILDDREAFYRQIVADDPPQSVFLDGWLNRCEAFRGMVN